MCDSYVLLVYKMVNIFPTSLLHKVTVTISPILLAVDKFVFSPTPYSHLKHLSNMYKFQLICPFSLLYDLGIYHIWALSQVNLPMLHANKGSEQAAHLHSLISAFFAQCKV